MSPYLVLGAGFALLGVAMLVVESLARAGRRSFRTVGEALHAGLLVRLGRWSSAGQWITMLAWVWVGFHFLAR
jgi:hypothetical protein